MYLLFYLYFTFVFYSFVGWIIEELYSKYSIGKFKKEGFLKEPLKPMYGIAMTLLTICYEFLKMRGFSFCVFCFLIPTIVEYISGYMLKHLFNKSYWDYSELKFNLNGYVSLVFSCYWCFLSYIGVVYLNPILLKWYNIYRDFIDYILLLSFTIFIIDLIITTNDYIKTKDM